jgi:hypothetical protein
MAEEAALPNIDKLFMETVRGRYPLADGPSTAQFWTPKDATVKVKDPDTGVLSDPVGICVPRPDRSMIVIQALAIFGFLGIDHFYLRSTTTGLVKLLTLGGLGIWWIWDMLQVFTERDRVLNYGLTTPFDIYTGIGQGMITDKSTSYTQSTSWGFLTFSSVFGFTGLPFLLLGKPWVFIRFLLAIVVSWGLIAGFQAVMAEKGVASAVWAMIIPFILFGIFLFVSIAGILPTWYSQMSALIGSPETVMKKGLVVPEFTQKIFGWWQPKFKEGDVVPEENKSAFSYLQREWTPTTVNPESLRASLWIGRNESVETAGDSGGAGGNPIGTLVGQTVYNAGEAVGDFVQSASTRLAKSTPAGAAASIAASRLSDVSALRGSLPRVDLAAATGGLPRVDLGGLTAGKLPLLRGGAKDELSTESVIIAAVLAALIGGGAVKAAVDYTFKR